MEFFASSQAGLLACGLLMALLLFIRYVRHARRAVDGWFGAATPARPELYGSYLKVIAPRPGPTLVKRSLRRELPPAPPLAVVVERAPVVVDEPLVEDGSPVVESPMTDEPAAVTAVEACTVADEPPSDELWDDGDGVEDELIVEELAADDGGILDAIVEPLSLPSPREAAPARVEAPSRPCRLVAAAASLPPGRLPLPSLRPGPVPGARAVPLRELSPAVEGDLGEMRVLGEYESVDPGNEEVDPRYWAVG